ncbi:MAG TPA: hypothetical protein DEF18_02555 [Muricauda sp.]|uniref:YCII-related domain-containing protein n=1 Tax=Flagellimonas aurea TaxID=2915619 RepID=A0ABS3G378_9FLAO|nr:MULTISPECIES: YciI family protein [Allomuricauda]MAU14238.1 hypothetical protein [Allomuricauda sp.]MBC73432.1 hypothetical protein [Allomuricauda sp.]MBO0353864.1 hypothetical protein [Allomuricauda aurea]HBU76959.1 hypothetical protein [Allomuricauda sp.]|tara:strand:+ start:357 stop:653 length:297 start_codon:yes stop_codon:yes gene_type:complete
MEKKYFVLHMYPLRPDFAQTRTTDEQSIMKRHLAYWSSLMNKGKVLVFGPVLDPKSPYGLGIIEVDNEQELKEFIENDPAKKFHMFKYFPMQAIVPQK